MANNSAFIIPINVQAIRVLGGDFIKFKGRTVNFNDISATQLLGANIDQNLPESQSPIDEGVHVHWSLPDSLTHGVHDKQTDSIIFPTVPNRWLVTRYFTPDAADNNLNSASQQAVQAHGVCIKQWVVESNRIKDSNHPVSNMATPIPIADGGTMPIIPIPNQLPTDTLPNPPALSYAYLGWRDDYTQNWEENETPNSSDYLKDLNAVSQYGPSFAAYYQNGATVFGLSDDFSDLGYGQGKLYGPKFHVSYQVIGWYSEAENNDFIASVLSAAQAAYTAQKETGSKAAFFKQYLEDKLKWHLQDPLTGDDWPSKVQSIYNGLALDIYWNSPPEGKDNSQEYLPQPQDVEKSLDLQLAIGNNPAEALSALISAEGLVLPEGNSDDKEPFPMVERHVELLFNAFQQDLLRRLAGTDPGFQIPQIEEYLHTLRFTARKGGTIWTVRPAAAPGSQIANKGSGEVPLPKATAELLSLLNAAQQTCDRQTADQHSRQVQAYLDWTRWGLDISINASDPKNEISRQYIESELLQIFTETGLSGLLKNTTNEDNQQQGLEFQPVWTYRNDTAAAQIALLSNAGNLVGITYPSVFESIVGVLQKALATFQAGNAAEALQSIQLIGADNQFQQVLSQVTALLAQPSTDNPVWQSLNTAVKQTLPQEQSNLNTANSANNHGLAYIINAYQQPRNISNAATALANFMTQQQPNLFVGSNLVDTQQIWLYVEAANYDSLELLVTGAKLKSAQTTLQQTVDAIKNTVLPAFTNAQTTVAKQFPTLLSQITNTNASIASMVTKLQNFKPTPQSFVEVEGDFLTLIQSILDLLGKGNIHHPTAFALRQAWQPILGFLPTGHQVVLLAQTLQDAIARIDSVKIAQPDAPLNATNIIQQTIAAPYWMPHEPVVVITQPDNSPNTLLPVNRNGDATLLPCRQAQDLLTALVLNNGSKSQTLTTAMLSGKTAVPQVFPNLGSYQDIVQQLLNEAYFLTPQTAYDLVVNVADFDKSLAPSLQGIQDQLFVKVATDQQFQLVPPPETNITLAADKSLPTLTATFNGTLPYYVGLNLLGVDNPFLPLFLAWKADYDTFQLDNEQVSNLNYAVFPPDFLSKNFNLGTQHTPDSEDAVTNDHVELSYGIPAPPLQCSTGNAPQTLSLSGQITLSTHSAANLLNQIRVYFKNMLGLDINDPNIKPENLANDFQKNLYHLYEYFRTKTIISQGLNGFNASLLQQLPLLQTPLNTIDGTNDQTTTPLFMYLQQSWDNPQWNKVTVGQDTNLNLFLPLRAGRLRLQELYIVDTFGRYFQIGTADSDPVQNKMALSASLQQEPDNLSQTPPNLLSPPCAPSNKSKNDIYLPPRFIQPSRLSFDWLSAQSEEGGENTFVERSQQPAFSPIAGWMLPNHLDDSLMLYDAEGNPLGELGIEGSARQTTWRSVPSQATQNSENDGWNQMQQDIADANPFLKDFLSNFAFPQNGPNYFQTFLDALDKSQSYIHTHSLREDKGLAVLIGRPFVLVRALLRLELMGTPNVALDSDSFDAAVTQFNNGQNGPNNADPKTWNDYESSTRFNANTMKVSIPVDLGDLSQFDDGLVGFFLGNDWSTFYTPTSESATRGVQKSDWGTIQLLPNAGSRESSLVPPPPASGLAGTPQQELVVTMIMDPRAAVHASTGILPVKSISIPPAQYQGILKKLMVYFLSNPVLRGKQSFDIPLPAEKGYEWSWVQPGDLDILTLEPNTAGDRAQFGFSPQEILDGWLELKPDAQP